MRSPRTLPDSPRPSRDWAEIQERMLVPLYETVYTALRLGPRTRLLGLGCGSGLALLLAAARGASVAGVESDEHRLALARERLLPRPQWGARPWPVRFLAGDLVGAGLDGGPAPNLLTVFHTAPHGTGHSLADLGRAAALLEPGSPVVLAGWGAPDSCAAAPALLVSARWGASPVEPGCWQPPDPRALEDAAHGAGLRPAETGEVACPFGYADLDSAVRGLLSTGCYEGAVHTVGYERVAAELSETLRPHLREDGTVWLPNVFRYLVAHTPCAADHAQAADDPAPTAAYPPPPTTAVAATAQAPGRVAGEAPDAPERSVPVAGATTSAGAGS